MKQIKYQFRMAEIMKISLDHLAKADGKDTSQLIREVLGQYITERSTKKKGA